VSKFLYVNIYRIANDQPPLPPKEGEYVTCCGAYSSGSEAVEKAFRVNKQFRETGQHQEFFARVHIDFNGRNDSSRG